MSCSLAHSTYLAPHISYGPATQVIVVVFVAVVQFHFSERSSTAILIKVVGKTVHVTFPKGNMGYDQYTVPVAFESTFVAFL